MRSKRIFVSTITLVACFCAIPSLRSVIAQGSVPTARAQFRSVFTDTPENTPIGSMTLMQNGPAQTFHMEIRHLEAPGLSIYLSTNSFYDGTNSPVIAVAPLKRTNIKNGSWAQTLTGTAGAPPQFQAIGVNNLSDMSNINSIDIGNPGSTNILGGTNFITCTQTSISNITVTICTTNIVGGTTNVLVNVFAWAPVPPIVVNSSASSFHTGFKFVRPVDPPAPHTKGSATFTYNGQSGRSFLNMTLNNLIPGQGYQLVVTDGGSNFLGNTFSLSSGGSKGQGTIATLRLDTAKGDSLPIQVPSVADLTGRVFGVRDGTGFIYLTGAVP